MSSIFKRNLMNSKNSLQSYNKYKYLSKRRCTSSKVEYLDHAIGKETDHQTHEISRWSIQYGNERKNSKK